MSSLAIEVWSDIACPWCWVGKRGLESAISRFGEPVSLRWRAFELNPAAPPGSTEPVDYAQRLANKYRVERDQAQAMIDRMVKAGRSRGLELRFDRIRPTNTFDAHRLLAWAHESDRQTALKEALFKAYLHEGKLISDHAVLSALAENVGLDPKQAASVLGSEAFGTEVRDDQRLATASGISGVPFFVFGSGQRFGVSGAQPPESLLEVMRKAAGA